MKIEELVIFAGNTVLEMFHVEQDILFRVKGILKAFNDWRSAKSLFLNTNKFVVFKFCIIRLSEQ